MLKIKTTTQRPPDGGTNFNEWVKALQKNKVFVSMISDDLKNKTYENLQAKDRL